ncbi:MAG: chemotaxis protein CheW [Proteobacteria bacterium]|nr:chemotaxis protein CheW [Pseudomonadota bacterium]
MSTAVANQSVHVLEIPTSGVPLILPSAVVAEIVNIGEIISAPQMPSWCIGVAGWRHHGVSIISFEALTGQAATAPGSRGKLVILFPFPGQSRHQFFGFVSTAEPQPHMLTSNEAIGVDSPVASPYIAAAMNINGAIGVVPNFDNLRPALFPAAS